jgi:hypothetical protein
MSILREWRILISTKDENIFFDSPKTLENKTYPPTNELF